MIDLPFRPNVCLIILNKDNKIFIGERIDTPGAWQLPQGGAEESYTDEENALREAQEEMGLESGDLIKIEKQLKNTHTYEWKSPPAYAVNKWKGQAQKFFILRFLGLNSDVTLDRFTPEFSNWRWCDISDLIDSVQKRRRNGYLKILDEVREFINGN